jgi:hypothetical protein
MAEAIGGQGALGIDDTKIWIVRKKADGYRYKIFHDGREERLTEAEEQQARQQAKEQ